MSLCTEQNHHPPKRLLGWCLQAGSFELQAKWNGKNISYRHTTYVLHYLLYYLLLHFCYARLRSLLQVRQQLEERQSRRKMQLEQVLNGADGLEMFGTGILMVSMLWISLDRWSFGIKISVLNHSISQGEGSWISQGLLYFSFILVF